MWSREKIWETLKAYAVALYDEWEKDNVNALAAALAYYATFSLVPTLLLIIAAGSVLLDDVVVRQQVLDELGFWVGPSATEVAQEAIQGTDQSSGVFASVMSTIAMLWGATQLFTQLQESLNRVWEVKPPGAGVKVMLKRRLLSLGLVAMLGLLLVASFAASAVIAIANQLLGGFGYWEIVNTATTYALGTLLFGAMFKLIPQVKLEFRDVILGAAITTALLMGAKYLLALYVGRASIASTYGAAGTLVVFLLWVYLSSQIVLMGAEFTQVHARMQGREIELADGAERRNL